MSKGWNNDSHGLLFKSSELKLYRPSHTYGMKLSQLWRQEGVLRIMTYSLPNVDYVEMQLGRRPYNIKLLAHCKFRNKAVAIRAAFPDIEIRITEGMHSKIIGIEPRTLYIGSANFGSSGWHETMIGVRSKEAHDYFVAHLWQSEWDAAVEVA